MAFAAFRGATLILIYRVGYGNADVVSVFWYSPPFACVGRVVGEEGDSGEAGAVGGTEALVAIANAAQGDSEIFGLGVMRGATGFVGEDADEDAAVRIRLTDGGQIRATSARIRSRVAEIPRATRRHRRL